MIYARDLKEELARDGLTRKQLAARHGVTSDRVTQWMCLLKLPPETQEEISAFGDHWDGQIITERSQRDHRRAQFLKKQVFRFVAWKVLVPDERNRITLTSYWIYAGVRLGVKKLQRLGIRA